MDSNHDKELQRLLCYHYTTGQSRPKIALPTGQRKGNLGRLGPTNEFGESVKFSDWQDAVAWTPARKIGPKSVQNRYAAGATKGQLQQKGRRERRLAGLLMKNNRCPVTRTFTITATDGCGNATPATVAYTWTGTVGGGGTNAAPLLAILRLGTNVVLFWSTSAAGYGLQSETNLAITNAWGNITNIPAFAGGTNYITNPISGSARFYRLAQ